MNIKETVEKYKKLIYDTEKYIWENPETGYKEYKTSEYMENVFESLGYKITKAGDIPGFYTDIDTGLPGPKILILSELDSLICPEHPAADKKTGAVHCCGHHAQCAAMAGLAAALKEDGMTDGLCGSIRLCLVPAEELIEIEYRKKLREKGIIKYFGGKVEFMHRGYFDGCDIAFMFHQKTGENYFVFAGSNGTVLKTVTYKGRAAHAGGAPHNGINALYAASLGLQAINSIRETFKDDEYIRVHPIITDGGAVVNAIPDTVTMESYVRGVSFDAIERENKKVNRALCGAALSIGANVDIEDMPGYAPLNNNSELCLAAQSAAEKIGYDFKISDSFVKGCTDMGDLSSVMPAIHAYAGGAEGKAHGSDYFIKNKEMACVGSTCVQLSLVRTLLENNAERANMIIKNAKPYFSSKEEYFKKLEALNCSGERITYDDNGASIRL